MTALGVELEFSTWFGVWTSDTKHCHDGMDGIIGIGAGVQYRVRPVGVTHDLDTYGGTGHVYFCHFFNLAYHDDGHPTLFDDLCFHCH